MLLKVQNGLLNRFVAITDALVQGRVTDTFTRGDLAERDFQPARNERQCPSRVRVLKGGGRPTAISRLVIAARVDAVDAVPVRAWPHVLPERGEVSAPAVTDRDTASAVEPIVRRGRRVAPAFHVSPRHVLAGLDAVQKAAVDDVAVGVHQLIISWIAA